VENRAALEKPGIIIAFFYKMTPHNHQVVVDEIKRLDSGGSKEDVDPETMAVCEKLTGLPYEKMYGG